MLLTACYAMLCCVILCDCIVLQMAFDDFRSFFWEVGICDPWELGVLSEITAEGMDVEIDAVR